MLLDHTVLEIDFLTNIANKTREGRNKLDGRCKYFVRRRLLLPILRRATESSPGTAAGASLCETDVGTQSGGG